MTRTIIEEVAKERFLDLMANNESDLSVEDISQRAISEARIFSEEIHKIYKNKSESSLKGRFLYKSNQKYKGCQYCFGSGGKQSNPCKSCNGTGKVKV